ncbi:NRDE-2, necessary for RNA interference-domain-containing protein [Lasiosphaeria hispida]|uniref:NRDE-2, necessary for RNA interference-domain-containing protein n=1 Tax=Lasiosphaeria hispida TaxID=260671 RepID=A0AAJ0HLU3_9PEZI|nr:NRDE-2, necessary for RNA interference-domain-containing protein [Lasiosphaeria hispida]
MSSRDEKKRLTVPKFGSFKPKEPETAPAEAPSEPAEKKKTSRRHDGESDDRRREYKRERERDSHRERGHHRRREREHERSPPPTKTSGDGPAQDKSSSRSTLPQDKTSGSDVFFVDKRGDPLILRYGTNERGRVPSYRRFGAGKVMGSKLYLTIHRDGPNEQFTLRGPHRDGGSAFRDRHALLAAAGLQANPKRIKPSANPIDPLTGREDFIALESSRKRKRDSEEESRPDYRSIYGREPLPDSDSDSDHDSESSTSSSPPAPETTTTKTTSITLSRRVRDDPTDIPAWLDLINLQDTLFRENHHDASPRHHHLTSEETQALAALKLSFYEKALSHATAPADRERLRAGIMREGARVWDPPTLARRWGEAMAADGGESFVLWRARLDYEMGRGATFTFDGVRGFITEKLRGLRARLAEICGREGTEVAEVCGQTVYVFLRLTKFLRDAGYVELAVAAWQVVLEMSFERPEGQGDDGRAAMGGFADFWESEVPRIGEDGAKGWRHFEEAAGAMEDLPEAKENTAVDVPRMGDAFKVWLAVEQEVASRSRMPARTMDEGTEDDPFRVVMFSDIEDLLVWFPTSILLWVRPQLIDAFLLFCGLPTAGMTGGLVNADQHDPFIAPWSETFEFEAEDQSPETSLEQGKRTPEFKQQGGNMALSGDILFSGTAWFQYLDKWSNVYPPNVDQVDVSWVLGTLKHLVRACRVEELAEYYLAMEWLNEPKGARKVAKGLLKLYSTNLRLYNAYALIEWANHNEEVSEKVLSSAASQSLPSAPTDSQLLWNTWTWIHLESGQKHMALARLCSSVDGKFEGSAVSPALLLKAKSHISSTRDYALSSRQPGLAIQYAESQALFEYLAAEGGIEPTSATQGNITAALQSIHAFTNQLTSANQAQSTHHERLLQTAARLLYHHATHGSYRPVYLRTELRTLTTHFPRNTLFLTLLAWSEQATLLLNDPVRTALQTTALAAPHDCLGTRRFAILYEARAGTAHATRAAFEAALESDACRGSVEVWVAYLRFCYGKGRRELGAKVGREVFYRAVAACPWAREVYLEGMQKLGGEEFRGVGGLMELRGVRVRVDLEGFLGRWEGR